MLDRSNEEAQLGLRWVALRKQLLATGHVDPAGADLAGVPYDGGEFATGVLTSRGTTALTSGSLSSSALPAHLRSSPLSSGALGTGLLSTTTGPLKAEDADKSVKMKVGSASGRRLNIPPVAIFFFLFSFILYAIVIWLLWPK